MSSNSMWWVHYTDAKTGREEMISLSSPDLSDPKESHRRARATAKKRLVRRGIKAINLRSQCVG